MSLKIKPPQTGDIAFTTLITSLYVHEFRSSPHTATSLRVCIDSALHLLLEPQFKLAIFHFEVWMDDTAPPVWLQHGLLSFWCVKNVDNDGDSLTESRNVIAHGCTHKLSCAEQQIKINTEHRWTERLFSLFPLVMLQTECKLQSPKVKVVRAALHLTPEWVTLHHPFVLSEKMTQMAPGCSPVWRALSHAELAR